MHDLQKENEQLRRDLNALMSEPPARSSVTSRRPSDPDQWTETASAPDLSSSHDSDLALDAALKEAGLDREAVLSAAGFTMPCSARRPASP